MNGSEENGLSHEQFQRTRAYIEVLNVVIEQLSKFEPTDRLDYASCINSCIEALNFSLNGWQAWLKSLVALNGITDEEYKELFTEIREIAVTFAKIDRDITSKKLHEAEEKIEDLKKETGVKQTKKTPSKKIHYVS